MRTVLPSPSGFPSVVGSRRLLLSAAMGGVVLAAIPNRLRAAVRTGPAADEGAAVALILIDFQRSNATAPFKPYGFAQVARQAARLAVAVRSTGGLVVHTRVLEDEMLSLPADKPLPAGVPKPGGATLVDLLPVKPEDVVVTKRQWGAFYGTDLEQQLRRRGISRLLIAGVATEVGVESTAREAYDRGYSLVFIEDALSGATDGTHEMFVETLFPRMGQVRSVDAAIAMLLPTTAPSGGGPRG